MTEGLTELDRWFARRGVPQATPGFRATEDVWTRAWPFLLLVSALQLFTTFSKEWDGWEQFVVTTAGALGFVIVFVVFNLIRKNHPLRTPKRVATPELAFFVLAAPLITWLAAGRSLLWVLVVSLLNVVFLGLVYVIVAYGLLPALWVGLVEIVDQIRAVTQLIARGLPILLVLTVFVFLNAEMWQVIHELPPKLLAVTLAMLLALAVAFLVLSVPGEVIGQARFTSWEECCDAARPGDPPINTDPDVREGIPAAPALRKMEVANVGILIVIAQLVQVLLVGVTTTVFYFVFGLLTVRRGTITQWTTVKEIDPVVSFTLASTEIIVTWQHLAAAAFVAGFGMLQFAVSSVTDATYRAQFMAGVLDRVRQVLAVRALARYDMGLDEPVHRRPAPPA